MDEMSRVLIRINIALKKALEYVCESEGFDVKDKLLFLLNEGISTPSDIMPFLCINKSNLALACADLHKKRFIEKNKKLQNRREITLSLTQKGEEYIINRLLKIENNCKKAFAKKDYPEIMDSLNSAKDILELL